MTDDEMREAAASVEAFTRGNDPNPGGRFPGGSYATPDEARERGQAWVARPGEPQDLNDPFHYQTPDQARVNGLNWATQPTIRQGRSPHPGMTALYGQQAAAGSLGNLEGYGYDSYTGPLSALMMASRRPASPSPAAMPNPTSLITLAQLMAFMQAQQAAPRPR